MLFGCGSYGSGCLDVIGDCAGQAALWAGGGVRVAAEVVAAVEAEPAFGKGLAEAFFEETAAWDAGDDPDEADDKKDDGGVDHGVDVSPGCVVFSLEVGA